MRHLRPRGRPQRQHPSEPRLHPARRDQGRPVHVQARVRVRELVQVRAPGFQRLNASDNPNNGVYSEAYRDGTHLAIIAINTNASTVNQKFIVNGNTIDTLTPWVTSPDDSLAAKSPVTLTNGSFTFELPAQSVVTFVNWDATAETPGLTTSPGNDGGIDAPQDRHLRAELLGAGGPQQRVERRRDGFL